MSNCTCTKDIEMTCIVHPTPASLKERIAELEEELDKAKRDIQVLDKDNWALREAAYKAMVSAQDEESADAYATLKKALEGGNHERRS